MLDASKNEVPAGFVLLQRHDGKPLYAACLDGGRFHGWLMSKHPDGQWVSQRKLESWEVMQSEDQRDYGIVHETAATKPTAVLSKRLREHNDVRLYHEADVLMSEAAAGHAYNKAANHYYGEFAALNPVGHDKEAP